MGYSGKEGVYSIVWLVCLLGKVRKPFTVQRQEGRLLQLVVLTTVLSFSCGMHLQCT